MSRPILHGMARARCFLPIRMKVGFGKQARHLTELVSGDIIDHAVGTVAKAKGMEVPSGDVSEEGDRPFWDFLNAHWAEIIALILKLIGL